MAAATTIIAAASAAVSIGKSIHDSNQANKAEKSRQKALENYDRQELASAYGGLSVPMSGYKMQQEEIQRQQAEQTYMLSQTGAQGAIGGASQISMIGARSMRQLSADLEAAQFRLSEMKAADESNIRSMRETREQQDIAGLGADIAYNRAKQDAAVSRGIDTMASLAELSQDTKWGNSKAWGGESNQSVATPKYGNTGTYGNINTGVKETSPMK